MPMLSPAHHVLVVDDDLEIRLLLSDFLTEQRLAVSTAHDADSMWQAISTKQIDLVILDLMMPGTDGIELCRQIRARDLPLAVIMLTARTTPIDRILGLEIGADDYLIKPFEPRELLARIKAVTRRWHATTRSNPGTEQTPEYLTFAGWRLDMRSRQMISPDQVVISLANSDFHVLRCLLSQPNAPITREHLMRQTFGRPMNPEDRAIDVCISRLRQHLEEDTRRPALIRTIRNEGYMIQVDRVATD